MSQYFVGANLCVRPFFSDDGVFFLFPKSFTTSPSPERKRWVFFLEVIFFLNRAFVILSEAEGSGHIIKSTQKIITYPNHFITNPSRDSYGAGNFNGIYISLEYLSCSYLLSFGLRNTNKCSCIIK